MALLQIIVTSPCGVQHKGVSSDSNIKESDLAESPAIASYESFQLFLGDN